MKSKRDADSQKDGSTTRFDDNTNSTQCVLAKRHGISDADMDDTMQKITKSYPKGVLLKL